MDIAMTTTSWIIWGIAVMTAIVIAIRWERSSRD
jgi:hypothetical protein